VTTSPTGIWNYIGGLDVLPDGSLAAITNSYLYKINATTGAIENVLALPTGKSSPPNTSYNGLVAWPDGTMVMKSFTRAPGCALGGGLPLLVPCPGQQNAPNSVIVVVNPKTWKVLDWTELNGQLGSRVAATQYHGKDYAYLANATTFIRYVWDGKNIVLDKSWQPKNLAQPGQTGLLAPMIAGDWVFGYDNNFPAKVPLSSFVISQANASKISRINPIPLQSGQQSYMPSNSAVDLVNHMFYVPDGGAGKLVGLKYNPETGNMSVVWRANQSTLAFMSLIGPANHRVLVGTNMHPGTTIPQMVYSPPPAYTEQVVWRDAATGKLLAASDYFSGMSLGAPPEPGYGGLLYYMTFNGHIMALQVLPKPASTNSTTTAPTAGTGG